MSEPVHPAGGRDAKQSIPRRVEEVRWDQWQFTERAVLCFIQEQNRLMLIHKKTGLGAGKINAPGGRIDPGEQPVAAAIRETNEEIGLVPHNLREVAQLQFIFTNGYSLHGTVFFADNYEGVPISTPEADPIWVAMHEIPYHQMWEDDQYWLPRVLSGEKILGRFIFEEDTMLSHALEPLS